MSSQELWTINPHRLASIIALWMFFTFTPGFMTIRWSFVHFRTSLLSGSSIILSHSITGASSPGLKPGLFWSDHVRRACWSAASSCLRTYCSNAFVWESNDWHKMSMTSCGSRDEGRLGRFVTFLAVFEEVDESLFFALKFLFCHFCGGFRCRTIRNLPS